MGPSTSEENKYEKKLVPTRIERCLWLGKKEEKATNVTGIEPMPIPAQEVANPTAELNCPCGKDRRLCFLSLHSATEKTVGK